MTKCVIDELYRKVQKKGMNFMAIDLRAAERVLANYSHDRANLIPIMQDMQAEYKYLPREVLERIAQYLGVSISKIYGVATFYENFSLEAKGKYVLRVCDGTACHVRKSTEILKEIYSELGLSEKKHTTDDRLFTLETVSCLGACGLAPVMVVNDEVHPSMTVEKVRALLKTLKEDSHD